MKPLWTPESAKAEQQREALKDAKWQAIYDSNPQVKALADKIHHDRMLGPPTCAQCIEIAVRRLEKQGIKL